MLTLISPNLNSMVVFLGNVCQQLFLEGYLSSLNSSLFNSSYFISSVLKSFFTVLVPQNANSYSSPVRQGESYSMKWKALTFWVIKGKTQHNHFICFLCLCLNNTASLSRQCKVHWLRICWVQLPSLRHWEPFQWVCRWVPFLVLHKKMCVWNVHWNMF